MMSQKSLPVWTPCVRPRTAPARFGAAALQAAVVCAAFAAGLQGADQPQWGQAWDRNMVSQETGLPASFYPESGRHVSWTAELGTEAHSTPVIAGGRVYIGTNNERPRDEKHQGDRGVLMCFDEAEGSLLWQLVVPKRSEDPYFDWPKSGISSPVTVEGDRVYLVSNRGEAMCLDVHGLSDGNDGPYRDEAEHMTPQGEKAPPLGPLDADIIWLFNLTEGAGIWSHDAAHSSILIRGDHLYLNSGTGVDNSHTNIRRPEAPSLIVLDKRTGEYLAREYEGIGPNIFHCTWSAPSMAEVNGRPLIFFAAGNGILYAFNPIEEKPCVGLEALKKEWEFDFDPNAPKKEVHFYHQNKREGPSNFFGMPVFHKGRIYLAGGGDLWWGKNQAWLKCVDAATGDLNWSYEIGRHVMSTPAVQDGLAYIADTSRQVHCVDARTGEPFWTHQAEGPFWASPYVADGKVYIGSRRGDFWVFEHSRRKKILANIDLNDPVSATAVAANGALYVATMKTLYQLRWEEEHAGE